MAQRTKRQHYVAQFHLAGFCQSSKPNGPKQLWLADTKTKMVRSSTPKDVALEKLFYDWRDTSWWQDAGEPPHLESFFSTIEGRAAPIFRRFATGVVEDLRLSDEDRYNISNYVGLQLTRTPLALRFVDDAVESVMSRRISDLADDPDFDAKWRSFAESRPGETLQSAETVRARIKTAPPRLAPDRDRSLGLSVHAGLMAAERIFEMPWCVLVAPDDVFFASDHPVFVHSGRHDPAAMEVSLALSSRIRLVAHAKPRAEGRGNIIHLTEHGAEECNRVILQAVDRFFFCATERLAQWTLENCAVAATKSILETVDSLVPL